MIRIFLMSARLGTGARKLQEAVEQIARVVRARTGLRVVLDTGAGHVVQHEAFDGAVVKVHVRELRRAEVGLPANRLVRAEAPLAAGADDRKPAVLRGDLDPPP